jgi:hypothetical protein
VPKRMGACLYSTEPEDDNSSLSLWPVGSSWQANARVSAVSAQLCTMGREHTHDGWGLCAGGRGAEDTARLRICYARCVPDVTLCARLLVAVGV